MNYTEIIAVIVIIAVVGLAVAYLIRQKKRGKRCIGCPYSESCTARSCCANGQIDSRDNNTQNS